MQNKGLIIGFIVVIAIFVVAVMSVINTESAKNFASNSEASVNLPSRSHNWGEIDINGGNVEHEFLLTNEGSSELKLRNFKTSCMCTQATVTINGRTSPYFGMHSRSSWVGTIPPGESATIKAVFDPLFHGPQGTGPITRLIAFETNDPSHSAIELKLTGNVIRK